MSMISELVRTLRIESEWQEITHEEMATLMCRAANTIEMLSEKAREPKWIPCRERLPERQGYYICTCKDGSKYKKATVIKWSNGWQLTGARAYWVVLAWMPLPEPWEGADDDQTR